MRRLKGHLLFSPTDLSQFFNSPFASWMERYSLDNPSKKKLAPEDPTKKLLANKGDEHEKQYLASLKKKFKNVSEIVRSPQMEEAVKATQLAMQSGADIIFQGAFHHDDFAGYTDFLKKVDVPSKLGDFSYEVTDIKLAHQVKPEYILQLSCYSEMLEAIQGVMPSYFHVALGNGTTESFKVDEFSAFYRHFKSRFKAFQKAFDPSHRPDPEAWEDLGDWADYAKEILLAKDHLIQVAGITTSQINKLQTVKITKMNELAKAEPHHRPKGIQADTFERLITQARLQVATKKNGKTEYELREINSEQAYGLQRLPPADPADIYFDMEGFPLETGGLEYLFGVVTEEKEKMIFKDWWATEKAQEKKAFEGWIDWAYARFRKNPNMHIYHYAAYEVTAIKKLMGLYMTREHEVDELLRHQVFVDLYKIVREGLIVGEDSYSIKKLEGLYDFKRQGDVKTAGDSVVQFAQWLELLDGNTWKTSSILKQIRDYNEEDCISTLRLTKWLRSVQVKKNITFINPSTTSNKSVVKEPSKAELLLRDMLTNSETEKKTSEVHTILSAALEYHRREKKPQYWSYFERMDAIPDDLIEDLDCLARCEITDISATQIVAKFDPEQETKMKQDSPFLIHGSKKRGKIEAIDFEKGIVRLNIKTAGINLKEITLIPQAPLDTEPMEASIYKTVSAWSQQRELKTLNPALKTLLCREEPKIKGRKKGQPVVSENPNTIIDEMINAIKNLDNSVLAIQGPPGSGKTHAAVHIIAHLLTAGFKVGVTSHGHKAINLVLSKVAELLSKDKKANGIRIAKIRREREGDIEATKRITPFDSAGTFWQSGGPADLVGGTSWFFSAEDSIGKFHFLFIEEAGQFALANAIACERSANNLVMLGDQMQLEQPIQGSHPECIARSVLNFYLDGHQTVPAHLGVFLPLTRRMRPEVCSYISRHFYEGRLTSESSTLENEIELSYPKKVTKVAGLLYCPVPHTGNSQGSLQEAEEIKHIVSELLSAKVKLRDQELRNLELNDILFVAPYNLQVGLLNQHIGKTAKVGSVDIFQGQEAPVVILSLCSSDGSLSPRGIEFILNSHRLNVAISRAISLAIVVGSPAIANTRVTSIKNMRLLNLFCAMVEQEQG